MATIYHNPRCTTSRKALDKLHDAGVEPTVVKYLDVGWTRDQLVALFAEAGVTPAQAAQIDLKQIKFAREAGQNSVRYFTDWALPQLEVLIDETSRPLEVWTTLDLNMQRAADAAIRAIGHRGAVVRRHDDHRVVVLARRLEVVDERIDALGWCGDDPCPAHRERIRPARGDAALPLAEQLMIGGHRV